MGDLAGLGRNVSARITVPRRPPSTPKLPAHRRRESAACLASAAGPSAAALYHDTVNARHAVTHAPLALDLVHLNTRFCRAESSLSAAWRFEGPDGSQIVRGITSSTCIIMCWIGCERRVVGESFVLSEVLSSFHCRHNFPLQLPRPFFDDNTREDCRCLCNACLLSTYKPQMLPTAFRPLGDRGCVRRAAAERGRPERDVVRRGWPP
jgi:hypothetical protein